MAGFKAFGMREGVKHSRIPYSAQSSLRSLRAIVVELRSRQQAVALLRF